MGLVRFPFVLGPERNSTTRIGLDRNGDLIGPRPGPSSSSSAILTSWHLKLSKNMLCWISAQQHAYGKQCFVWPTWKSLVCRHFVSAMLSCGLCILVQEWTHWTLHSWQLLHIVATQSFLRALETFGHACSNQQQANSREIPHKEFSRAFTKLFSISTRVSFDTHQIVVLSQTGVVVRLIESCLPAILLNSPQLTGYSCCW